MEKISTLVERLGAASLGGVGSFRASASFDNGVLGDGILFEHLRVNDEIGFSPRA